MEFRDAILALAWVAIVLNGLAIMGVIRQLRLVAMDIQQPPSAPPVDVPVGWSNLVLLFASASCLACREVVPAFADATSGVASRVVFRDEGFQVEHAVDVVTERTDLFKHFAVSLTPYLIVTGDKAVTRRVPVGSATELTEALRTVQTEPTPSEEAIQ